MLKKISLSCLMLCILALAACGSDSPSDTVNKFLTAQYKGTAEESYQYLCKEDKAKISLETYKKIQQDLADPMLKNFFANAGFEVKETAEQGDKATVTVDQEIPDIEKLLQASLKVAFNNNLKTDEEKNKALLEELGGSIPGTKITVKYTLLKEDGEWKIKQPNTFNMMQ